MLQPGNGGRRHEHPSACQQSHGLPQAAEVSTSTRSAEGCSLKRQVLVKRRAPVCHRYEEAEEDCSRAIRLDASYSKAFARRGSARAALGKLQEAKQGLLLNSAALGHIDQVRTSVCMVARSRFRGGAEAGTREQAGPERAPESAGRTLVHPVISQWDIGD